jgi:hypothetical protein
LVFLRESVTLASEAASCAVEVMVFFVWRWWSGRS